MTAPHIITNKITMYSRSLRIWSCRRGLLRGGHCFPENQSKPQNRRENDDNSRGGVYAELLGDSDLDTFVIGLKRTQMCQIIGIITAAAGECVDLVGDSDFDNKIC